MVVIDKSEKVVGILGGMGPLATIDIFSKIVKATPAKKDWEHLRIIIDNNPKIPSRTRAVILGEESPLSAMIETARNLERAGANFIILPCNSAHFYFNDLQSAVNVPILNIIEITANFLAQNPNNFKTVGVLGGLVTIDKRLYETPLKNHDITMIVPDEENQKIVSSVIEGIKIGKSEDSLVKDIAAVSKTLAVKGAQCVILACTELSILLDGKSIGIPMIDANVLLAEEAVKMAKNGKDY